MKEVARSGGPGLSREVYGGLGGQNRQLFDKRQCQCAGTLYYARSSSSLVCLYIFSCDEQLKK